MARSIQPFLMFGGQASEATEFYVSLFPGAQVERELYAAADVGAEGSVKGGTLTILGQSVRFIDSPIQHEFSFTPAWSFFVECEDEAEIDKLYAALSKSGAVLMALGAYGFSRKFGWVDDRFGVSWQLNLA